MPGAGWENVLKIPDLNYCGSHVRHESSLRRVFCLMKDAGKKFQVSYWVVKSIPFHRIKLCDLIRQTNTICQKNMNTATKSDCFASCEP